MEQLRAAESLHDWMFYKESHRRLFRAMTELARRGDVVDAVARLVAPDSASAAARHESE